MTEFSRGRLHAWLHRDRWKDRRIERLEARVKDLEQVIINAPCGPDGPCWKQAALNHEEGEQNDHAD